MRRADRWRLAGSGPAVFRACAVGLLSTCVCCLIASSAPAAGPGPSPRRLQAPPPVPPSAHIPVNALGFQPPSRSYLIYRVPSATLDFIDDTHLLFTFHQNALMRREEKEPEDDQDQTMTALVLELPGGKVIERADWRLHDKNRYLWALGAGRFLERERNDLFLYDKTLASRTPYFHADGPILAVQVAPDRRRLLVQYQEERPAPKASVSGDGAPAQAPTLGADAPPRDAIGRRMHQVRLMVIDASASHVEHTAILAHAVALPLVQSGYLELEQGKGKQWKVLLTPFGGKARTIAELASGCQPTLDPLNGDTYMAQLCIPYTTDHLVQAYSIDGKKLWEQQWDGRYVWGSYAYAENGSRFAYESIELDHPIATLDPVDETFITGQPVGVFDVADGTLRLVAGALPILSAGQNFALSADGERFAVLRDGAIEIYTLPPAAVR